MLSGIAEESVFSNKAGLPIVGQFRPNTPEEIKLDDRPSAKPKVSKKPPIAPVPKEYALARSAIMKDRDYEPILETCFKSLSLLRECVQQNLDNVDLMNLSSLELAKLGTDKNSFRSRLMILDDTKDQIVSKGFEKALGLNSLNKPRATEYSKEYQDALNVIDQRISEESHEIICEYEATYREIVDDYLLKRDMENRNSAQIYEVYEKLDYQQELNLEEFKWGKDYLEISLYRSLRNKEASAYKKWGAAIVKRTP